MVFAMQKTHSEGNSDKKNAPIMERFYFTELTRKVVIQQCLTRWWQWRRR